MHHPAPKEICLWNYVDGFFFVDNNFLMPCIQKTRLLQVNDVIICVIMYLTGVYYYYLNVCFTLQLCHYTFDRMQGTYILIAHSTHFECQHL